MHVNLFVKVGRAAPKPCGSYPDVASAAAAQASKTAELLREGHAPERINFTTETVGAAKKGKQ